jgi:anti-sigma B factor antagonist
LLLVHLSTEPNPDGPAVLVVSGEVDLAVAEELRTAAEAAAASSAGRGVVFDLSAVTFLDSTGLGALVSVRNSVVESGAPVVVRHPSASVMKVFKITGLADVFDVEEAAAPPGRGDSGSADGSGGDSEASTGSTAM